MAFTRRVIAMFSKGMDNMFQDGLDTTAYLEHIEREFAIRIRDEDAVRIKTLGDLCELIAHELEAQGRALNQEVIWPAVRRITGDEFGVNESDLHERIRFAEDLKC